MKEEFEYNRWYLSKLDPKYLAYIGDSYGYGFNTKGEQFDRKEGQLGDSSMLAPATEEEVEKRLLAYAKEKYPVGTKYRDVNEPECTYVKGELGCFKTLGEHIYITDGNDGSVYFEGKWAEIIPEESSSNVNSLRSLDVEELKVGDWVTLLQSTIHPKHSGRTGEITKVESQRSFKIVLKDEIPLWESCINVRKATPEEIAKVTGKSEEVEFVSEEEQFY